MSVDIELTNWVLLDLLEPLEGFMYGERIYLLLPPGLSKGGARACVDMETRKPGYLDKDLQVMACNTSITIKR